ncbi:MAG TPA: tetratricopeptide repeat protein [Gemmatimonadaceae bacterium]|nr:tetratricopeptide repeat protein [Gemmatimonadaceae bacterium]
MFESDRKLRHLPFFEEIASRSEGDPEWHSAVAGMVVLRLVDAWLDEGAEFTVDEAFTIRSVESVIEEVRPGSPIRTLLQRVMDALRERKPDIHVVVTPLMAYAQALEYDAKWTLATDVYHSVLAHLHPMEDTDASIAAHLRLGSCYRAMDLLDEASTAYAASSDIATAAGDMLGILRARVGEAAILSRRGNYPRAQDILDDAIARANGENLRDVRSRALHQRANVAKARGQYELAIRFAYDALHDSETPTERDRILGDIAGAFSDLGVYTAARDAYLVLSVTAQEQFTRWAATLNLLDIAVQNGSELLFEQHRRQLLGQSLPPYLATGYQLSLGQGYQRFGDEEKARRHLTAAVASAREYGLNALLFDAEEALLGVEKKRATSRPPQLGLETEEVAGAIRALREAVGVA